MQPSQTPDPESPKLLKLYDAPLYVIDTCNPRSKWSSSQSEQWITSRRQGHGLYSSREAAVRAILLSAPRPIRFRRAPYDTWTIASELFCDQDLLPRTAANPGLEIVLAYVVNSKTPQVIARVSQVDKAKLEQIRRLMPTPTCRTPALDLCEHLVLACARARFCGCKLRLPAHINPPYQYGDVVDMDAECCWEQDPYAYDVSPF